MSKIIISICHSNVMFETILLLYVRTTNRMNVEKEEGRHVLFRASNFVHNMLSKFKNI